MLAAETNAGANHRVHRDRGAMTLYVVGLCVVVLFVGGLSVDFWRIIAARRSLAAMADASATAGANGLDEVSLRSGGVALDPSRARVLASDELTQSSEYRRIQSVVIESDTATVRVTLVQHVEFSLLGILGDHDGFTVRVVATAAPRRLP